MDKLNHNHIYIGGMCQNCGDDDEFQPFERTSKKTKKINYLKESEVNDEEVTRYKKFGVG